MITIRTAALAWVAIAFGLLSAGHVAAAEEDTPWESTVVKAEGEQGLQFLRDFDAYFRASLREQGVPEGEVNCVGCEALAGKGSMAAPTELSYCFPESKARRISLAVVITWFDKRLHVADDADTPRPKVDTTIVLGQRCGCAVYPQRCYYRPMCAANPTPFCSRSATGPCLPGCL